MDGEEQPETFEKKVQFYLMKNLFKKKKNKTKQNKTKKKTSAKMDVKSLNYARVEKKSKKKKKN